MKPKTVALLPLLLALGCGEKPREVDTVVAKEVAALPVHVAVVEQTAFLDTLSLYARVEANERVRVTAEAAGLIEAIPFAEGQSVKVGQTLARINARVAEAQVKQAAAQLQLARASLERTRKLSEKQLNTRAEVDVAEAQAAQAEAAHELALIALDKAVIRAAIHGVVASVTARKGELAAPGVPLLEVVQIDPVKVVADVPERDVPLLDVGGVVSVEVEAFPGKTFEGKIAQVALVANGATRTFPVDIVVPNPRGELRPGMLARAKLVRRTLEGVVVVPRDAVLDEADGKAVYVVEGEVARRRVVEVGSTRGRFAVATSGIAPGDRLIVLGHRQAVEGQKVSVAKSFACCKDVDEAPRPATDVMKASAPVAAEPAPAPAVAPAPAPAPAAAPAVPANRG